MLWFLCAISFAAEGYLREPTLQGSTLVFVAEGDLWQVSRFGGRAHRLTSFLGEERHPVLSHDGQQVAFAAEFDGNWEVYVAPLPAKGREILQPQRLTWHGAKDVPLSWSADDQKIFFASHRHSPFLVSRGFGIAANGGMPEPLDVPMAALSVNARNGQRLFQDYDVDWQPWKRYRGGMNPDIWLWDSDGSPVSVATADHSEQSPFWVGTVPHMISDASGKAGIYRWSGERWVEVVLPDEWDLRWPTASVEGVVVAGSGGGLVTVDLVKGRVSKIPIRLPKWTSTTEEYLVDQYIEQLLPGPLNDSFFVVARGQVWQMPWEGMRRGVLVDSAVRYGHLEEEMSPERLLIHDTEGQTQIAVLHLDGSLTDIPETRGYGWMTPPRRGTAWIAASGRDLVLRIVPVEGGAPIEVHAGVLTAIDDYEWSEDGRYLAYSALDHRGVRSIYLYDVQTQQRRRLTRWSVADREPVWLNGDIYFIASSEVGLVLGQPAERFFPVSSDAVYRVTLNGDIDRIDWNRQGYTSLASNGRYLFSMDDNQVFSWYSPERSTVYEVVGGKSSCFPQRQTILCADGNIVTLHSMSSKKLMERDLGGWIETVDLPDEWSQMFEETVRAVRFSFWQSSVNSIAFEQTAARYRTLLPLLRTRLELRDVQMELLAELEYSHNRIVYNNPKKIIGDAVALLGANLLPSAQGVKIAKILDGGPDHRSPVAELKEGDCIFRIDGVSVEGNIGPLMMGKSGQKIALGVGACDVGESKTVVVRGIRSEQNLRQKDWAKTNREIVHQYSDGRIGYVHANAMSVAGIEYLMRWLPLENRSRGLIVDMRWNGGGQYEAAFLEQALRMSEGRFLQHNGAALTYPVGSASERRVVLVNGFTQSSAEGVAIGAQREGVPLVGTRTWGGYSGSAWGIDLVDGSQVGVTGVMWDSQRYPAGSIENRGIVPDVVQDNPLQGTIDKQLVTAIDLLMGVPQDDVD